MKRKHIRIHGWFLALTAAIFLSISPALAPVISGSSKNSFIEICTAFGAIKMAVSGDEHPDKESADHALSSHCVLCQSRLAVLLSPPQAVVSVRVAYLPVQWAQPETVFYARARILPYDPTGPPASS